MSILTWIMVGFVLGIFSRQALELTKALVERIRGIRIEFVLGGKEEDGASEQGAVSGERSAGTVLSCNDQREFVSPKREKVLTKRNVIR
jgi:hypothetical protein